MELSSYAYSPALLYLLPLTSPDIILHVASLWFRRSGNRDLTTRSLDPHSSGFVNTTEL